MKLIPTTLLALFALTASSFAGGIQGRVLNQDGVVRSNVKISVKGYRQTTTTDSNGYYTLKMPAGADGSRVNVYVNGNFAVNCLVPVGDVNSTVNVTIIRK